MSLAGSMYTAANGISAHANAMNVVSDNIANVNTTGFKSGSALFEDVLASSGVSSAGNGIPNGQGSNLSSVQQDFSQGTLLPTGQSTDLSLEGNGFFIMSGEFLGESGSYYTRSGRFHVDETGNLVNPQGLAVQGYLANSDGVLETGLGSLQIGGVSLQPPQSTANVSASANLDSGAAIPTTWDLQNPGATSSFSTSVTVYDSRGENHNLDLYFSAAGSSTYNWYGVVDGAEIAGGTAGTNALVGSGTLTFNTNGSLATVTGNSLSVSFTDATPNQAIALDLGDPTGSGGTGIKGLTSYAGTSNLTMLEQDGFSQGALVGLSVTGDGVINGNFTNGKTRVLGQVAVASFASNAGLARIGDSMYAETAESGLAIIGNAATGGRGSVASGSLEQSNVNLAQEFINLMAYQRGFEANTRTVQVADQMMQELVNLGR